MLTKLIFKLVFRAMLPLVAMVGIASFGLHAAGGDPLAILKRVGGGFGQQVASLLGGARDSAESTLSAAKSGLGGYSSASSGQSQQLYRWTDSSGVTHFSSEPPSGAQNVTTVTVDPNQNLMTATPAPRVAEISDPAGNDPVQDVMNQSMPGISGMALQGMNPNDIIEQFQKSQASRLP